MTRKSHLWILRTVLACVVVFASLGAIPRQANAAQALVQVNDVNGPWINLTLAPVLNDTATPSLPLGQHLTLAAADFDANGTPEIVVGYATDAGGRLALYHGNAQNSRDAVSFAAVPTLLELPGAPDFLYAGDFNADGLPDLVAAARGGETLWLLPGKGAAGFGTLETLKLPGALTALTAGELYRQDGLSDLAAGIETPTGAQLLVFAKRDSARDNARDGGRDGGVLSPPEIYELPKPAVALAIGELDDAFPYDLAIAAGSTLAILHGHDQLDVEASVATLETFALDFAPVSLALGDFRTNDAQTQEIALLGADGAIHLFDRRGIELGHISSAASDRGRLLPLRISSLPATELLAITQEQVQILTADGQRMTPAGTFEQVMAPGTLATLNASASVAAVLPLRLNDDQLDDLVLLTEQGLTLALTTAFSTYTVNTTADVPDNNPGDNKCEGTLLSGVKVCSLRAAIQEANAHAGFDFIEYTVEGTVTLGSLLPDITEAVTLDHEQNDKKLTLDGRSLPVGVGINIRSSDVALSRLKLINFVSTSPTNPVVKISSGTNNRILMSQIGPGNAGTGVQVASGGNRVDRSIIAGNNVGVVVSGGSGTNIGPENFIGRGITGSNATNAKAIEVDGATNTKIGDVDPLYGTYYGDPNIISGNTCQGVYIQGTSTSGTLMLENYIGVNAAGDQALGNGCAGVYISGGAASTTIGNNTEEKRNVISANSLGIVINQAYNATASIRGNFIGVNAAATTAMANQNTAVWIDTIGVIQIAHNVIGGAPTSGSAIFIRYSLPRTVAHQIEYNHIGANASGANFGHGLHGIEITDISGIQITNNTIRFNGGDGISTQNGGQFTINNNTIIRNGGDGIDLTGNNSTITNNIIGYNGPYHAGIAVAGSTNTLTNNTVNHDIQSGQIGIGVNGSNNSINNTGTAQIGGGLYGVALWGGGNTLSGYTIRDAQTGVYVEGDDNIIATGNRIFNNLIGIHVDSNASGTQVRGNFLGVDATGNVASPNYETSIQINGTSTTVGGSNAADGNVISGGGSYGAAGVRITGGSGATLRYNKIGVGADGTTPVGNLYGIYVLGGTQSNIQDNVIAYNNTGILVAQGTRHAILGNSIHSNAELGIDLSPKGVTLNDTGDSDSGPNALQNFPVITLAGISGSTTRAVGTLNSLPSKTYTLRFYSSPACDASNHGEGRTYLGQGTVTTDASGNAPVDLSVSTAATQGHYLALTATDPDGNTSEFSACYGPLKILGPTTFSVNQAGDFTDSNLSDGVCDVSPTIVGDQCTLRAAVQQANANTGANTIILPAGTYVLSLSGIDATAAAGDLDINDALAINGAGANLVAIQNQTTDRVFEIRSSSVVTLTGVTVKGGITTSGNGAGILINSGTTLTADGVSVQENQTGTGSGGGIYSAGTLKLLNSAVISNTAGGGTNGGGGIFVLSGESTLRNVTVSGNQTKGNGGGIQNLAGTVNLNNVTVAYNTADSDNVSGGDGGGLWNTMSFNVKNSIIAENIDVSHGVYHYGVADCSGTFTSQGYNLVGDKAQEPNSNPAACQGFTNYDSVGGQWMPNFSNYLTFYAGLSPLALNGGTTPSHSPFSQGAGWAVDQGNPATPGSGGNACEPFDQRGQARPIDGGTDGIARCDRGAVEMVPASLSISDVTVTEGSIAAFAVTLSAPAPITFTVQYSTTNITAVSGQDYNHTAGTLTFGPGQSSKTVSVPTLTDTVNETAETFRVRLYAVQYVLTADNEGIGTINDGSAQPSLSINNRTVIEGDAGSGVQALFTVSLNSPSGKTVTVDYATANGTALAGEDYGATQGTLSFAPGVTSRTIAVNIIGDNLQEANETFSIVLSNPVNATIGNATGAGAITDDDTPAFSIADAAVDEGDSGTRPMVFIVELSKPSTQAVTVKYSTSPGTAQSGSDYVHTSGTLTFAAGETLKTITVQIVGDTVSEPNESFTVALNTPSGGATIARGTATGMILDDGGSRVFLPLVLRN